MKPKIESKIHPKSNTPIIIGSEPKKPEPKKKTSEEPFQSPGGSGSVVSKNREPVPQTETSRDRQQVLGADQTTGPSPPRSSCGLALGFLLGSGGEEDG